MTDKLIIRTSDRGMFLTCRLKWDFGSKIRMDLEPLRAAFYYDFGTAWHAALEKWYDPNLWAESPEKRKVYAKQAFDFSLNDQRAVYRERGIDSLDMDEEFDAALKLGPAMLDNYAKWSLVNDDFTPLMVEKEFEVQIGWYVDPIVMCFGPEADAWLRNLLPEPKAKAVPIYYQGRIDGLVEDFFGNYWVLEHKSAEKAPGNTRWLQMDSQSGSYIWALQKMLGLKIKGVIHTTTIKKAPHPPKINKNGHVSIDKSQLTNAELFKEAVRSIDPALAISEDQLAKYNEYLGFLTGPNAPQFIYREMVARNPNQINNIGKWVEADAREMLSNPEIKPTPSMMNCNGCRYYNLSLAWQEGSDWQFIAETEYVKRTPTPENTTSPM